MTNTYHLQLINKALKKAIKNENRDRILELYEEVKQVDLESVSWNIYEEYDALVDQANDILMEEAA